MALDEWLEFVASGYVRYMRFRGCSREFRVSEEYRELTECLYLVQDIALTRPMDPRSWEFFTRVAELAFETGDASLPGIIGEGEFQDWLRSNLSQVIDEVADSARRRPDVRQMLSSVILDSSNGDPLSIEKIRPFVFAIL